MNEQNIFIVRCGEVALKGMNKPYFERMLVDRIRKNLKEFDAVDVRRHEGLIFVRADKKYDKEQLIKQISKVFGVASISPAVEAPSNLDAIGEEAVKYMMELIETKGVKTFKVEAKRADKNFPVKSPDIGRIIGAKVLIGCKVLKVDVHNPDVHLFVDVRHDKSYIYQQKIAGFGGLPLGTNGKGMVLLSGGIDSPVAAWMMAKRGMVIEAVHFHSYPYTSQRAQEKVEDLARIVASYCGNFKMHVINLLPIQEQIVQNCPEEETTILVRRFMMRIAEKIAEKNRAMMLITGENLGQVASQTAEALVVTDACVKMPVMRPLIAMDKVDIMDKAEEIGTFETSIQPYEDCCTVFLPKHPTTKPKLERILESESHLDVDALVDAAVASAEVVQIRQN
ncbi:MAG: tRNA 4-thiouridine(8) synthase ThiI [Emergencia sp.]|jgi:thiamine biosynthesis protein ThiI|uniref:Probable tRNA sulfurtransferase n=1 Tax=Anaerotruncus colihominis TaxID=169435 RepID=A0A845QJ26_9FIRM|nr:MULTISPECIES: tRNA uracil 4-sulfurtransferase ThiI [Eubacteriales]MCI9475592.1 tRNA 4-thiouridine(8) synthase ThiI [Emergencia sp.]MCI9639691.1 tRNA 4-thiouridine(8) synthase ThiI [Emergencia sp.]NBH61005.1 tRNA 4-thiouridine(8) synthase ThiI [Anaerotruncus colihominis]NCF01660.1 tRNA 4-thiouridine(8) synthase ThiI [Anaerotruncus sp. 80]